jgi:hypothetical protein
MTNTPSWGEGGAEDQDRDQGQGEPRQPWFPPGSGEYGQAPPGAGHDASPGAGYGAPPGTSYGAPPGTSYGAPPGTGYGQPGYGTQPGAGYGAPRGGWAPPSQAPKPGVIPLRPVAVGEILDGAFTSIRRNPKATLGIAAVVLTVSAIITTSLELILLHRLNLSTQASQPLTRTQVVGMLAVVLPSGLTALVVAYIVQILLTGLLTAVVGRSVLGYRITAGEAWRVARPRLPALLLATLLVGLAYLGPWAGLVVVLFLLGIVGAPAALLVVVGVLGGIASFVVDVWFWAMFSMSAAAVVLEHLRPRQALARSWRLVRNSFWRVFGILLLAFLIVFVASSVLRLPFTLISAVFSTGATSFTQAIQPSLASLAIGAIGGIIAGAITQPIWAGVTVLLYVDLRMRREGLDLILQTAISGGAMSGDDFATLWRPAGPGGPGGPGGPAQAAPPQAGHGPAAGSSPPATGAPPAW